MFAKVASLTEVDVLITDTGLPKAARKAIQNFNIDLMETV